MPIARTAIVSAMQEELAAVLALAGDLEVHEHAGRRFHRGELQGEPVVLVLCGIGKVAAATTATLLAERHGADRLVFTGVAGGLGEGVCIGDAVLATELVQHDMDARPLFPRYEVPLTGRSHFPACATLNAELAQATRTVLDRPAHWGDEAIALGVRTPRLHHGLVLSGDRFVSTREESEALRAALPAALAVEMEGAALAQVCHDLGLPFAVLRTISDRADDTAHLDFGRFIQAVAAQASAAIIDTWLKAASRRRAVLRDGRR